MSTGQIIGGIIGGVIGFMIGGPIGAAIGAGIGMGIGMMADPVQPDIPAPGQPDTAALSVNQVKEGALVTDVLGTTKITAAATYMWYGGQRMEEIVQEVEQPGGKGGGGGEATEQVVGYKYFLSWALGICKGPVDYCYAIDKVDLRVAQFFGPPGGGGGEVALTLGGGLGSGTFFFGTDDQDTYSAYLNHPYRGLCYLMLDDCHIGGYNRAPNMRFIVTKRPNFAFTVHENIGAFDYNPACAIWYIFTEMLGLPESYLDSTSFSAAATTLYTEGLGISISFNKQQSATTYIETILKHIEGIVRYENDGKFHLKLLRADEEIGGLPVVTEDEIIDDLEINRKSWLDVITEIKIQYVRNVYAGGNEEPGNRIDFVDAEFNVRDMAIEKLIGKVNHQTVRLGMFTAPGSIAWIGDRLLRSAAYPLASISFTANRNVFRWDPGDSFVLNYAPYSITGMVCRVQSIVEEGPETEEIRVIALEDICYMTEEVEPTPHYTGFEDRDLTVVPLTELDVFELPFVLAGKDLKIGTVAGKKTVNDLGYLVYMSIDGGTSYNRIGTSTRLTPHGVIGPYTVDTYRIDDEEGFEVNFDTYGDGTVIGAYLLETCTRDNLFGSRNLAILGNEIISFQTITPVSGAWYKIENVFRGRFDTPVEPHSAGTDFWFLTTSLFCALKNSGLFPGATRHFKYVPFSARYTAELSEAASINETITGRAFKPYVPGCLQANGNGINARYTGGGDIVLSWRARVRAASWADFEANVPATYEGHFGIEVWVFGALVRIEDPIDAVTWTYTNAMNVSDNGSPPNSITFKLTNYDASEGRRYDSGQVTVKVRNSTGGWTTTTTTTTTT